jgi:hypothetical protein
LRALVNSIVNLQDPQTMGNFSVKRFYKWYIRSDGHHLSIMRSRYAESKERIHI